VRLGGAANPGDLGPHRYDAARGETDGRWGGRLPLGERNAVFYACRGGFIDSGQVREGADLTAYLISQFARSLEQDGEIELTDFGARLRIVHARVPPEAFDVLGRDEVIVRLAAWSSYQVGIWHEIAQWYGGSMPGFFPDLASAFSPEEIYSYALGVRMLGRSFDWREFLESELAYDRWIGEELPRQLGRRGNGLRAVPGNLAHDLIRALDGSWWDSSAYLPDARAVTKRFVRVGSVIEPWEFPRKLARSDPELLTRLDRHCDGESLRRVCIEERIGSGSCDAGESDGVEIRSFVKLTVTIRENDWLARMRSEGGRSRQPAEFSVGTAFDQERFSAIAATVLEEMKAMLMDPHVDVPDVPHPSECCGCDCTVDPMLQGSPRRAECECSSAAAAIL